MNQLVTDYLKQIGFSRTEINLYLGLLKLGKATILELSKETKIKRATAHFNIESLIQKGIVSEIEIESKRYVLAEPPENLEGIIEQKKLKIDKLSSDLPNITNIINTTTKPHQRSTQISAKVYSSRLGVKNIYKQALEASEFRAYFKDDKLDQVLPENENLFTKEINRRKDFKVWEIIDYKSKKSMVEYASKLPKEQYKYKVIPKSHELSAIDYMIFDGKVAIVDLSGQLKGILIENQIYYQNAKSLFQLVWDILPE
jgi:sugar-specific transcriptional regulator TrmB